MNWNIKPDASSSFFRIACSERFAVRDCRAMLQDLISRSDWRPGASVLVDYRQTDFTDVNSDQLREMSEFQSNLNDRLGDGRTAVLVKPGRDFGLARQYEMLAESNASTKLMVLFEESEAVRWLSEA
jgi:hypothetical protein